MHPVLLRIVSCCSTILLTYCLSMATTRIACVGDVNTDGLHTNGYTWADTLGQLLGDGYEVRAMGTQSNILSYGEIPYVKTAPFNAVRLYQPAIIIINLGTTDTKPMSYQFIQGLKSDLQALLDTFLTFTPRPTLWLCAPVPIFENQDEYKESRLVNGIIPVIEQTARERAIGFIDLHGPFIAWSTNNNWSDYYLFDEAHNWNGAYLNREGLNAAGLLVYTALTTPTPVKTTARPITMRRSTRASAFYHVSSCGRASGMYLDIAKNHHANLRNLQGRCVPKDR